MEPDPLEDATWRNHVRPRKTCSSGLRRWKPLFLAGIVFDITDTKERMVSLESNNRMLADISAHDGLTGLLNHKTLMERLSSLCRTGYGMQQPLSIAMIDIDDFKHVNDTKGHVYGDQVLANVAAVIRNGVRDTDAAGRYGGEEFLPGNIACESSMKQNWLDQIRHRVHASAYGIF